MATDPIPFTLSRHAMLTTERRGIKTEWVARTLADPASTEPDRLDPLARHALRPIPEFGGRVLRVVYNPAVQPLLVITAYFDRSRKGTM